MINDSDLFIQIEAIQSIQFVLEVVEVEVIEKDMMPNLLKLLKIESQHEDIISRMAEIIGPVTHKLQQKSDLHLKYK